MIHPYDDASRDWALLAVRHPDFSSGIGGYLSSSPSVTAVSESNLNGWLSYSTVMIVWVLNINICIQETHQTSHQPPLGYKRLMS